MRDGMVRGSVIGEGRGEGGSGKEEGGGDDGGCLEDEHFSTVLTPPKLQSRDKTTNQPDEPVGDLDSTLYLHVCSDFCTDA